MRAVGYIGTYPTVCNSCPSAHFQLVRARLPTRSMWHKPNKPHLRGGFVGLLVGVVYSIHIKMHL